VKFKYTRHVIGLLKKFPAIKNQNSKLHGNTWRCRWPALQRQHLSFNNCIFFYTLPITITYLCGAFEVNFVTCISIVRVNILSSPCLKNIIWYMQINLNHSVLGFLESILLNQYKSKKPYRYLNWFVRCVFSFYYRKCVSDVSFSLFNCISLTRIFLT